MTDHRIQAPVYVAGTAIAECEQPGDKSLNELVFEAAASALNASGLTRADVDGVCLGAADQLDGRAISSMLLAGPAGGYLRDEVKISGESTLALVAAALRLEAGAGRRTLVVSWTKSSESPIDAALAVNPEPVLTRPVGLHPVASEAMVCARFVAQHNVDLDTIDAIARDDAARHAIVDAPLAWPLRTVHVPPPTDGAVALLLTTESTDVELASWAFASEHHDVSRRDADASSALRSVATRALSDARMTLDPSAVVETTDRNTFRLCIALAGLGLANPRDVAKMILEGSFPSVNCSGGLWSSNPPVGAGLERVVRAIREMRHNDHEQALAHSSYGLAGQGQFVSILRRAA